MSYKVSKLFFWSFRTTISSTGEAYRPLISLYHTQLNAYVEGFDFELSVTGTVRFKHE